MPNTSSNGTSTGKPPFPQSKPNFHLGECSGYMQISDKTCARNYPRQKNVYRPPQREKSAPDLEKPTICPIFIRDTANATPGHEAGATHGGQVGGARRQRDERARGRRPGVQEPGTRCGPALRRRTNECVDDQPREAAPERAGFAGNARPRRQQRRNRNAVRRVPESWGGRPERFPQTSKHPHS